MPIRESDGDEVHMRIGLVILVVLVVIALLLGSSFISRRNQMAIKREAVNAAWAQVDVVLQRRADLIPNLVETVKGFAVQEQIVFGDIAKARSRHRAAALQRVRAGLQHVYLAFSE